MRVGGARRSSRGHETDPSRRVGHRLCWSAGRRRKSKVECRPNQRKRRQRKLKVGHWGNRRTQHRLYYRVIKIETPEASVSGVFNFRGFFADLHANRYSARSQALYDSRFLAGV